MQPLSAALTPHLWGLDMGLLSSGTGQGEDLSSQLGTFQNDHQKLTPAHY